MQTISLAHNNFVSGRLLSRLSHYLPTLANLSLQGNKFSAWKDLDHISGRKGKLSQLKELILLDNPLRNIEYGKDSERYKRPVNSFHSSPCIAYYLCSQVARRFPSLEMLDMEPIPKIAFDVPHASASHAMPAGPAPTTFPVDMGESFIAGVDGGLLSGFLMRYVECVPVRSMAVLMAGSDSCLCLIISVQRLWTSTIPTPHSPIQPIPPSLLVPELKGTFIQRACHISASRTGLDGGTSKLGGSRNLSRLAGGSVDKLVKSLHVGTEEIVKAMAELPSTKHDVAGSPEKFCIDAWPVQQGDAPQLFVTIHGQFEESMFLTLSRLPPLSTRILH